MFPGAHLTQSGHDTHATLNQLRSPVSLAAGGSGEASLTVKTEDAGLAKGASVGKLEDGIKGATAKLDVFMALPCVSQFIGIVFGLTRRQGRTQCDRQTAHFDTEIAKLMTE